MPRKTNKSRKTIRKYTNKKKRIGGEKYAKSDRKTIKKPIVAWEKLKKFNIAPIKEKNITEKPNLSEVPIILVIPTHGAILSSESDNKKPSIIDLKTDFPEIKSLIKIGFSQPGNLTLYNPNSEKYSQIQFMLDLQSRYGAKLDIPTLLEYIVTDQKLKYNKYWEEYLSTITNPLSKTYVRNKLNENKMINVATTQNGEKITSTFDDLGSKYTVFRYVRDAEGPQQGLYDKTYSYDNSDMDVDGEIMSVFTDKMEKEYHCISDYDIDDETEVSISLHKLLSCISKKYSGDNVNIIIIDNSCNGAKCELQAAPAVLG